MTHRAAPSRDAALVTAVVAVLALVLQLPLILNPGYFSHDELQWAARAAQGAQVDWSDTRAFQYRPVTFALWLQLSRALFATPWAFHAAIAAFGAANAALLARVLLDAGAGRRQALGAALVFVAGPYAMYVHGWVATLADLLWVGCGLIAGWIALRARPATAGIAACALTALALLAKEAALSLPALAVLLALFDPARRRAWLAASAGATLAAAAWLVLRAPVLTAPPPDPAYAWSLRNLPWRALDYPLYLPNLPVFEVHNTLARGANTRVLASAALWLALVACALRAGLRTGALLVLGAAAALGPVLVLGQASTQYGYGFAAWTAGAVALAWPRLGRVGRAVAAVLALLAVVHGANVARQVRHVGKVQAVFSPALARLVADRPGTVVLAPEPGAQAWIFERLTHDIPAYGGVALGDRVRLAAPGEAAAWRIRADGRIEPAR